MQQTSKVGRQQPQVVDYSAARAKAIAWLGDRYLLAKPINRKTSPPTTVPLSTPRTLAVLPAGYASRRPFNHLRVVEARMNRQMILLRVEQGVWEGWQWMALDDFLQRVRLDAWKEDEESMVGMILPAGRQGQVN